MRKIINLADREEVIELLKQLYGKDEVKNDHHSNIKRETGTESPREVVKLPPNCS